MALSQDVQQNAAEDGGFAHADGQAAVPTSPVDAGLMPRAVRRWLLATIGLLLGAALYLIAVRGSVILFDLRDAVSAMCF